MMQHQQVRRLASGIVATIAVMAGSSALALDISGSSTIQPIVEKLVPLYAAKGGEAVTLSGGGSGAGIKNALAGTSQIGMVSRALTDGEKTDLKYTTIGIDALAIVVNAANPIAGLTKAQLVDIYSGKINNWKALGGPDRPLLRISKEVGRSTLELFEHYTGLLSPDRNKTDKPLISRDVYVVGANLEAVTLVGGMPGAIGYVSVGTAENMAKAGMPIRIVKLEGVVPGETTIKDKSYPIVRELNLAYRTETPVVTSFLGITMAPAGQDVVKSLGFMAVSK